MYHHAKFELPSAFNKEYMYVQSCLKSMFISINIVQPFRQANPKICQNCNFDKIRQKR